jgi:formylglycine-generating enzyme required for sulfatase activity
VAVITAVLVLLVQAPVKALVGKLGRWLEHRLEGLGFRFTKRHLEALADRHRWLRLIGIYSRSDLHPPRLQEVYISLRLASPGGVDADRFSWSDALGPDHRRVAILGAQGAGKTTLLDYLVLVLTSRVAHPLRERLGKPFPLFARLRELGADPDRATLTGLLRASTPLGRLPGDFPDRWLRRGGCAVLLDGLDEVLDEARHQRAVEEIERLVADYPDNRFIVTCRVAGWQNQFPDFRTYELGFVEVPAGEFLMGSLEAEGHADEHPRHSLYLPTYFMGRYPVTVAEFRKYLEESGTTPEELLESPIDHPVRAVSWHEALACARWFGATLPSEAEWEKASRGTDGRRYPWGNEWRQGLANTAESWQWRMGRPIALLLRRLPGGWLGGLPGPRTTPVGRFSPAGDSAYGCADMAGNVWEWTRSLGLGLGKPPFRYPYEPGDGREDLDEPDKCPRVLRGGGSRQEARFARCSARLTFYPYSA